MELLCSCGEPVIDSQTGECEAGIYRDYEEEARTNSAWVIRKYSGQSRARHTSHAWGSWTLTEGIALQEAT